MIDTGADRRDDWCLQDVVKEGADAVQATQSERVPETWRRIRRRGAGEGAIRERPDTDLVAV